MMIHPRLARLALRAPFLFFLTVGLGLLGSLAAVGQGFATGHALAEVLTGGAAEELLWLFAVVFGLILSRSILLWTQSVVAALLGATVKLRMRREMYGRLLDLGHGYSTNLPSGEVQATLSDGLEHLDPYVSKYLPQAVVALVVPLTVVAYLATIDLYIGGIVLAGALFIAFGPRVWQRTLGRAGERHWASWTTVASQFVDGLLGMITLKAFNASRRFGRQLRDEAVGLYLATRHLLVVSLASHIVIGVTHSGGLAAAGLVGAFRFTQGDLSAAELLVVLFLANEAFRPLSELAQYWHQGYMGTSAANGIFAMVDAEEVLHDTPARDGAGAAPAVAGSAPTVRFEGVSYRYPGATRNAVDEIDVEIAGGRTLAIVGRSGSGKTTLISLLLRAFDPTDGRITIDEAEIRSLPPREYRTHFAYVSQDVYLFYGTVADNLRLARESASDEELIQAARDAGVHEFVAGLPDGYETMIGERGVRLSGGERQRVAIARAFLKDAPVLVLDEPTSSLDGENERHVRDSLLRLMKGRATVVISHRLSAVDFADEVVMLEAGRVVERGAPGDLLHEDGRFAALARAQVVSA